MLKIESQFGSDYTGFKLTLSEPGTGCRGSSVIAEDVAEVKLAVDHYFARAKRPHGLHPVRKCPLCRDCAKKAKR